MDFLFQRCLPPGRSRAPFLMFCLLLIAIQSGCSKEKLEEMAAAVQDQATNVQKQARDMAASTPLAEVIPASGRAEVGLPSPVQCSTGYVRLYVIGDGRPSIVQFTSYDPEQGPNSYPALLVRAITDATTPQMLGGKTLDAEVYLQAVADGPLMTLAANATIPFVVSAPETQGPQSGMIMGSASSVTLIDTTGNSVVASQIVVEGRLP